MSNKNNHSGGITATGALQLIFIVLKLIGVITWSWWWVLSPLWITAAILIIGFIIIILFASRLK